MIFNEFPDLTWLKNQIAHGFNNRLGWKDLPLERDGFPSVIIPYFCITHTHLMLRSENLIMKRKSYLFVLPLFILLSITECSAQSNARPAVTPCDTILLAKLLNSERIEKKFGGYGIEVLYNSDRLRVSNLYDGKKITRTLAVVDYPETIDSSFAKEHAAIVAGGSIGQVFKSSGWLIEKKNIFLGELPPSSDYKKLYALMGNIPPSKLSVWIYVFYIRKGDHSFPYATISEVYHPAYLSLPDLTCINKDADAYSERTKAVNKELRKVTRSMALHFNAQQAAK